LSRHLILSLPSLCLFQLLPLLGLQMQHHFFVTALVEARRPTKRVAAVSRQQVASALWFVLQRSSPVALSRQGVEACCGDDFIPREEAFCSFALVSCRDFDGRRSFLFLLLLKLEPLLPPHRNEDAEGKRDEDDNAAPHAHADKSNRGKASR
jgi:hypothetical protein